MIFKISTAWLQLKHEKMRLMVAIGGISFAVVLIFMQLGLRVALFDSAVALYSKLEGDIFLLSPRSTALIAMENFSERRLYQTLAFPEVKRVIPIYLGFSQWKNPQTRNYWRNIYVIGFELAKNVFNLAGVNNNIDKLQEPDVVLFDAASRTEFGPVVELFNQQGKVETEVGDRGPNNRKITVVGLFELGTSFGADGNLITSDLNFLRIFVQRQKGFINLGIVQLHPGYNPAQFIPKLKDYLPPDIRVMSRQELMDFEKEYWNTTTPIGFVFAFGVILGSIVGIIIVYQILYSNVSEHLAEYATLKAMGYRHRYLLTVIFQEALILAILGYIPGFFITLAMYQTAQKATNLPIAMEKTRALMVLSLTILICFISGAIAVRKLQEAEPADIF
ncbi:ABC transporter permease DevC [Microcystis aeruginosa]|jgi:putative ABC transport system permease protein|uniref:DevC protein n=3 Tax=Microcystis TaxID=1125 RepID=I4HKM5_MICAE|nr:ABC transporter permease DevC [Microcystis aeruginosa]REJ42677.1 MAG: ABC transporter permease [Microcystis flos-aquae TF09]REJ60426.1 MAG: ABC transporter permease [Microcystis aeruginosa DA14]CCI22599.1 DevC protein [Microcystis aeruginosa PCC 9808]